MKALSCTHTQAHTHVRLHLNILSCCLFALDAGRHIPREGHQQRGYEITSQHETPCNGTHGYQPATQARIATVGNYPASGDGQIHNAIACEDPTHLKSDRAKAAMAI